MIGFELINFVTKDGLEHQGIVHIPDDVSGTAVLWIHGLTGRFYGDVALMNLFAKECAAKHMAFASVNTRGHEYLTSTHMRDANEPKGYRHETIGAGVERFTDCVHDIDAAITCLTSRGIGRVVLAGHSTGANKVCYYAATVHNPRVSGVVLSGPMSDRYSAGIDPERHRKHMDIMRTKLAEGKGDELLTGFDFFPLTPRRWMSLFAEGSPEGVFNYQDKTGALLTFSKIHVPLLVVFAGDDEHADAPILEIKKAFDTHAQSRAYKSVVIENTDHGFTGKEKELVNAVVSWSVRCV